MRVLTDKERQEFFEYAEEFKKKIEGNRELALDFFSRVGICTKDGELTELYKNLRIPRPANK